MKFALAVILPLYALDQLTKWLVLWNLEFHESIPVIPGFFNLVHVYNTGAAFGIGKGNNVFFIALSASVAVLLVWLGAKGHFAGRANRWAASLLGAGILGNVTDRLLHGHVVDFLDFHIGNAHWPAFNVADSCICVAAGLFILAGWRQPHEEKT